MDKKGYLKIMKALINLIIVIMIEAGKVPVKNAMTVGGNILKAVTGGAVKPDEIQKEK